MQKKKIPGSPALSCPVDLHVAVGVRTCKPAGYILYIARRVTVQRRPGHEKDNVATDTDLVAAHPGHGVSRRLIVVVARARCSARGIPEA